MSNPSKTILITGCTSGIGLYASKLLHAAGHRLILVGRTKEKASIALKQIASQEDKSSNLIPIGCDFTSFKSIKDFPTKLNTELKEDVKIDVVCLNAGMCSSRGSEPTYTEDGIETTLATNHFGPFLFLHHIFPWIDTNHGRIIITASGVHNTDDKKEPLTYNNFKGIKDRTEDDKITMIDGSELDHYRSYALSKLCNVSTCLELSKRLQNTKITANCFCPNLITSTGLFRSQNYIFKSMFGFMANTLFKFGDTLEWGGGALAYLAAEDIDVSGKYFKGPTGISRKGGVYAKDFVPVDVSKEAGDVEKQLELWNLSAEIVGIDPNYI